MAYQIAKFKWGIVRLCARLLYPITNNDAVRVYQHYPDELQFFYVYRRVLAAKAKGLDYIIVEEKQLPYPKNKQNVLNINNFKHLRNKRKNK